MNFHEIESKIGFPMAVVICFEKLSKKTISKFTSKQWEEIIFYVVPDSVLERRAIQEIDKMEKSFEEWEALCTDEDSAYQKLILRKLQKYEKSFEEWKLIFLDSAKFPHVRETALEMMVKTAKTFDELFLVSQYCINYSSEYKVVIEKMQKFVK